MLFANRWFELLVVAVVLVLCCSEGKTSCRLSFFPYLKARLTWIILFRATEMLPDFPRLLLCFAAVQALMCVARALDDSDSDCWFHFQILKLEILPATNLIYISHIKFQMLPIAYISFSRARTLFHIPRVWRAIFFELNIIKMLSLSRVCDKHRHHQE